MTEQEQRNSAKEFVKNWSGRGYEKGESQPFWLSLLQDVFGVEKPSEYITFEQQVHIDNTAFIDGYIDATKVMIEQKSLDKDLRKAIKQSDGTYLTPFQQAKRYSSELPYSQRPRWIITSNFKSFLVYDMENPTGEPEEILLENLPNECYRLAFLIDNSSEHIEKEMEISIKAGEIVGRLYDAILKQYKNPSDEHTLKSLNMLCVRLVFCLYAEDAGIFGKHLIFHDYLKQYPAKEIRSKLMELFHILDTKPEYRDDYLNEDLAAFPYVNGGLFADEEIEIPNFSDEILDLLLNEASVGFDWSEISPTIFGAVFESTLNPETRRGGGMHYTSIENIHKVINPLFLDDLKSELEEIKAISILKTKNNRLEVFQEKLSGLKFLDPACGSGNFLTETYLSLRKLENEVIALLHGNQITLDTGNIIKVSIGQFYGIEINDFAVTVAKTALWIAESQMMKRTEDIIKADLDFLPLKSYANIVEGNALRLDWNDVVPKHELNYIMGNPPFVGARLMTKEQKDDLISVFGKMRGLGDVDYVSGWYKKACEYMRHTSIETAFVSTNSISQGEQPAIIWSSIDSSDLFINFAHRTFRWDSEANAKAHVHCVIIGFSYANRKMKCLYENDTYKHVNSINAYLLDAPNVLISSRSRPLCPVPTMDFGSMPNDNGYLSNYSTEEKDAIIAKYPKADRFFKQILGADEFINNKHRWCLWLKDISPIEYIDIPPILNAIKCVEETRKNSKREATQKLTETPMLFGEIRQPKTKYLLLPSTSSENRKYIPIGFVSPDIISSNANIVLDNANLYQFGVLTSNVHMAWMRAVCGRLEMRYRYSIKVVYNNFPWPNPTAEQKSKIEQTAQAILDARETYSECSFAQLYGDSYTLFTDLVKAHQENDRAVMKAYGFDIKTTTESSCVAELMKMYQELTKE